MTEPTAELREWLQLRVAQVLERAPEAVSVRATFTDLGLSSLQAVELSGDLQDHLGHELSPTLFYDFPTIEALVAGVIAASGA